jgi:hypothetical protein
LQCLKPFLKPNSKRLAINIAVPDNFPKHATLAKYLEPNVHPDQPLRERDLLSRACLRFNFWKTENEYYAKILSPVILTRLLVRRDEQLPRELIDEIELVTSEAARQQDTAVYTASERKVAFRPWNFTTLHETYVIEENNMRSVNPMAAIRMNNVIKPFHPDLEIDCEIPTWLLQKVSPYAVDKVPPTKTMYQTPLQKRPWHDNENPGSEASAKKIHVASGNSFIQVKSSTGVVSHVASGWKPQQPPPSATSNVADLSDSDDELEALRFKPRSRKSSAATVFHPILHDSVRASDIQEQEEKELQEALRNSLEDLHSTSRTPGKFSSAPRISHMPKTSPLAPLKISPDGPNFA